MAHYHPETPVKAKLAEFLRKRFPRFVIARIENQASNALPDIVVNGNKITSWIEVKYATPDFRSKGDQELMMLRLDRQSYSFYVVFYDVDKEKRTYIVNPKEIGQPIESWTNFVPGFDYLWVTHHVARLHRGNNTIG